HAARGEVRALQLTCRLPVSFHVLHESEMRSADQATTVARRRTCTTGASTEICSARGPGGSADAGCDRPGGNLGARVEGELRQDAADIALDRALAHNQAIGNRAIR